MTSTAYHIRPMTRSELDLAVDWAAAEGWNPGLHDADCFYRADPTGFLMGFLEGEPIASISAVKYGETFGFIGFYIVKPDFRGRGYGLSLWQAALKSLNGRNIGLDGVVTQQDNYVKSGFELAYRNIRYEGVGQGGAAQPADCIPLASLPVATVVEYDRPFFPEVRSHFTQCWITQPNSYALGIVTPSPDGQTLIGYGVLRPCQRGYKIGPLFADNATVAEKLLQTLIARIPSGSPFYLDVPEINPDAVALAQRHNMSYVFETARMYTQAAPTLAFDKLFGVTTFELG